MTQLTYTIINIKIGAEKYWEEVEGFVSGDKKTMITSGIDSLLLNTSITFIKQNPSHPLSELANRLGATIYGGFEDKKDFCLVLPTVEGFKVGDCLNWYHGNYVIGFSKIGFTRAADEIITERWLAYKSNYTLQGNIFQEYARTGIIENDLYKHFFK